MARDFVGLKLRLMRNRLSTGGFLQAAGFVVIWLMALSGGLGGAALMALIAREAPDALEAMAVLGFAGVGLVWLIVPIVIASLDDSLDARSFETLPLDNAVLARGLLIASLVGPGTLATAVGLGYGSLVAFGDTATAVPIIGVAATAVLFCIGAARYLTTRLSDLLRQRRGQEIAVLVVVVLASVPGLFSFAVAESAASGDSILEAFDRLVAVVQWTPWGALGRSVSAFGEGEWLVGLGFWAIGLGALLLVLRLYARAIERLVVVAPTSTVGRSRKGSTLLPKRIPLPESPAGAVAAKEIAYLRRDVRVRSQLIGGGIAVVVLGATGGTIVLSTPYAPFLAVFATFIIVTSVTPNQFGFDGGSFWAYVTVADDLGSVVRGKNLGWAVVAVPVGFVVAIVAAAVSGEWVYLPAALFSAAVVALIWLGVGDITSIYGAFRLPETNLFGSRNLSGGAFLATFIGIAASGLLTVPPLLAIGLLVLLSGPLWATVAAFLSVGYAVIVYRITANRAAVLAEKRRFHLIEVLDGD